MSALSIAFKDLQIFFKDRGGIFQLILLPLIFILVISGAFSDVDSETEDERILLPVVNLDGSERANILLDGIEAAGGVRTEIYDQVEATSLLENGEIMRMLTIPEDFTSGITGDQTVTLRLTNHSDADAEETEAVRLVVEGAAQDLALEKQILASLQQMGEMQANAPQEFQEAFSVERIQDQAREQFEDSEARPLITVVQTLPRQEAEREEMPAYNLVAVPGFTVLFVFLTAQMTARSIYDEKKIGSFRRLMAAPISKASLLVGKVLPNFILGLFQITIIFFFGSVVLELLGFAGVPLGDDILALVLVAVAIVLCSSSMGIVIAALARTEGQIGGLSSLLLWGMAVIGGSIIPVFVLDQMLGPVPKFVPHYWANRALNNLMIRGLSLTDLLPEIGFLLGFALLFFAIGLWRFDYD
ncbi:MAG: ABC transporter permease [Anaerolineales bacterium]|jgi:ABC-2 type transport system permease protein